MELALPLFGAIKSQVSGRYLCYNQTRSENFVRATGNNVFSTNSKVQFERAKSNRNYVHIRFCHDNKYRAKAGSKIVANASKRNGELPSKAAFQGSNGKLLQVVWRDSERYLQFSSSGSSAAAFEPTKGPEGNFVIKSPFCDYYWRVSSNWVLVDSKDPEADSSQFQLFKNDDGTYSLFSPAAGKYCERSTSAGMIDCFKACADSVTPDAKLVVIPIV